MELGIRHKTLLKGIVYFKDNPYAGNCLVRELSPLGARLELIHISGTFSDQLELQIPSRSVRRSCKVSVQSGAELIVDFVNASSEQEEQTIEQRLCALESEVFELKRVMRLLGIEADSAPIP